MKKIFSLFIVAFMFFFSTHLASAQISSFTNLPAPTGYINDYTNTLSPSFKQSEEQKLTAYTKATTNEIAVVLIQTTGNDIEDYAQALADKWKPGVSGKDNGILIVFAMQDHQDRIATGCGFEGNFTDIQAQDILDNDTEPLMKAGQYDQAVNVTVNDIISGVKGATLSPCKIGSPQQLAAAKAATANNGGGSNGGSSSEGGLAVLAIIILILLIIVGLGFMGGGDDDDSGGSSGGSGFGWGALAGGIGSTLLSSGGSGGFSGGGFGGFSGGSFGGGGASGGW